MPQRAIGYEVPIKGRGNNRQRHAVARAKELLNSGKRFRKDIREEKWVQAEKQYDGRHWDMVKKPEDHDLVVVNMSFSTVNTIVPYMTGSDPHFMVQPYGDGATARNAALQQAFLNRQWRSQAVQGQNELETSAVDFIINGDGYMKVGYTINEKRVGGPDRSYAEVAELWVAQVDPWDVWIDPTSQGIHNARWVAHRIRMTREELAASGYSNVDDENVQYGSFHRLESDETGNDTRNRTGIREAYDGTEYAVLYEFHDRVRNETFIFTMEGTAPLVFLEDVPACPIVQMGNYRLPGTPYHMGELEQLWGLQQELNKTRSQMITHRARNVQKFGARKGILKADAKAALRSGTVNEVVEVDSDEPLENIVRPFPVSNLSADVYNVSDIMMSDIYEISGINEYLRGSPPDIRRTATEATIIEGASNIKSQFKLKQVERAARKVGELLLWFAADIFPETDYDEVQLYLTGRDAEAVGRVANEDEMVDELGEPVLPGQDLVMTPTPDMWDGEYEVFVEQHSTEMRNPVMREQKYRQITMDLINVQPALQQQGIQLDLRRLVTMWLEAAGVDDVDSLFLEQPAQLEPGQVNMDIRADDDVNPELLAGLLEQMGMGGGEDVPPPADIGGGAPDEVPPDVSMGAFTSENTGQLPPQF